jgi:hypothetical protein
MRLGSDGPGESPEHHGSAGSWVTNTEGVAVTKTSTSSVAVPMPHHRTCLFSSGPTDSEESCSQAG